MKMKKALALVLVAVTLVLAGCQSTGRVIASASSAVDHGLKAYAVLMVDEKTTSDQDRRVKLAQERYYAAEDAALTAYLTWYKTGDDTAWERAKAQLLLAQSNLLNLLREFGVKGV